MNMVMPVKVAKRAGGSQTMMSFMVPIRPTATPAPTSSRPAMAGVRLSARPKPMLPMPAIRALTAMMRRGP